MYTNNENDKADSVTKELIEEIHVQLGIIRSVLLEIKIKYANKNLMQEINEIIYKFFRAFHCINGISDFVDFNCVKNICIAVELFLNKCKKNLIYEDNNLITNMNIITNAIYYIEKICDEPDLQNNEAFRSEMHLFLLTVKSAIQLNGGYEVMR